MQLRYLNSTFVKHCSTPTPATPAPAAAAATHQNDAMKSPTAAKACQCMKCKASFIIWKGHKAMCDKCWGAIAKQWAAEDARLFYTSHLAGYND